MKNKKWFYVLAVILGNAAFIVGIIALIVFIFHIVFTIGTKDSSDKAKIFAENFLSDKYETQMVYESIDLDFINGGRYVYFYPEDNPEINFKFRVFQNYKTFADGSEKKDIEGYVYSAD